MPGHARGYRLFAVLNNRVEGNFRSTCPPLFMGRASVEPKARTLTNSGGSLFNIKSKDYEFIIDAHGKPRPCTQGRGKGITSPDTLLASLGSCIGVYLRKYAEGTKLGLKEFTISVSADLSEDKPVRFKDIYISIDLKGTKLNAMQRNGLLAFIKNCPVHNTLKTNPAISVEII